VHSRDSHGFLPGTGSSLPVQRRRSLSHVDDCHPGHLENSLTVLLYLQGNVLVWDYGVFNGTDIAWRQHRMVGILEVCIWLGILGGALIFHHKVWRAIPLVAALTILLQLGTIGSQLSAGQSFEPRMIQTTDVGLFEFSPAKNVLIILLDAFPSPTFDQLLERDKTRADQFTGFTYFRNTVAVSPYTLLSIPTIFSGKIYDNSEPIQAFMSAAFDTNSLPWAMRRNGYSPHIVTAGMYGRNLAEFPFRAAGSFVDEEPLEAEFRDILKIWDVTLFRYAPHFLKRIINHRHAWILQRTLLPAEPRDESPDRKPKQLDQMMIPTAAHRSSARLWDRFLAESDTTGDRPTFKFFHFFTSHPPYLMGADGTPLSAAQYEQRDLYSRCLDQCDYTLDQVLGLLDKLRELGILDQTLVVIMADHGSNAGKRGYSTPVNRGLPLLLIKPIGAHRPLRISNVPASLMDIPATLSAALFFDAKYPGVPLLGENNVSNRRRQYFYFTWEKRFWNTEYLPLLTEYIVSGPAWRPAAWRKERELTPESGGIGMSGD